ncbi:MAG: phosphoribosyltransferase family protein [Candidatus Omnitrophica bacterium]|jgi:predicted phosphoribosyltransferase|nr:phosphoribosyltransferase family protein [Candidatus Omnitrophota bacterium]
MFKDREDAGKKLARALKNYKDKGALVLGIPRGGAVVGYEVARYLNADFSIVISRKLPFPGNPEFGFGALAEDGSLFILGEYEELLPRVLFDKIVEEQKAEITRRILALRKGEGLPEIAGRTVILVDDGIAMGSTLRAAILLCKNKKAQKIIAASPVSGEGMDKELLDIVDEAVILEKPAFFRGVAQGYQDWHDVPDEEVTEIIKKWKTHGKNLEF